MSGQCAHSTCSKLTSYCNNDRRTDTCTLTTGILTIKLCMQHSMHTYVYTLIIQMYVHALELAKYICIHTHACTCTKFLTSEDHFFGKHRYPLPAASSIIRVFGLIYSNRTVTILLVCGQSTTLLHLKEYIKA